MRDRSGRISIGVIKSGRRVNRARGLDVGNDFKVVARTDAPLARRKMNAFPPAIIKFCENLDSIGNLERQVGLWIGS